MGKQITYDPANLDGCAAYSAGFFTGKIAYVRRGGCNFNVKVDDAAAAGAVALVVGNNRVAPISTVAIVMSTPGTTIPSMMVDTITGNALQAYIDSRHTASSTATGNLLAGSFRGTDSTWQDYLADFSSRGPTPDLGFKPDITAPGVNILSSVSPVAFGSTTPAFDLYQGTSMATPHVTGSTALLRQLHPNWTPAQIKSALMSTASEPASLGADPTERGAGRLNLTAPDKVGVTFDKPGVSFGLVPFSGVPAADKKSITITATNMTAKDITYTVAVVKTSGLTDTVVVQQSGATITSLKVLAHGKASFTLVLTPGAAGGGYGEITFTDKATSPTPALHLPYWASEVTKVTGKDFLVIADDGSAAGCPDYLPVYTTALTNLGYTFDTITIVPDPVTYAPITPIDWNAARQYKRGIIYYESDFACATLALNYTANVDYFRNYLVSGGKMIVMGQDFMFSDALAGAGLLGPYTSVLPSIAFGAQYVQDNLFRGAIPPVSVVGDKTYSSYLSRDAIGLDPATAVSIDEVDASIFSDIDTLPILSSVPLGTALLNGTVGTRSSVEPTLERVLGTEQWTRGLQRSELVTFGLQDMVDGTPLSGAPTLKSRTGFLGQLVNWLGDQTTIQFDSPSYTSTSPDIAVPFTTTPVSTDGPVLQCRFDFGDGSAVVTIDPDVNTGLCSVNHKYPGFGFYNALAESWDAYGHKFVSSPVMVEIGLHTYLPLIFN